MARLGSKSKWLVKFEGIKVKARSPISPLDGDFKMLMDLLAAAVGGQKGRSEGRDFRSRYRHFLPLMANCIQISRYASNDCLRITILESHCEI